MPDSEWEGGEDHPTGKGRLLKAEDQEGSVPRAEFTAEELAEFVRWFDRVPSWKNWERRGGGHGEDVLEIAVEGGTRVVLKVAKTERSGFIAAGFGGWGLTVCDDFEELMGFLAQMSPSICGPSLRSGSIDAAA